jgi:beta-phosphoglucomutase
MTPADILPGVTEFLAILAFHKLPCAIGTASRNASLILEKIGLADFFPVVIDGNRVNRAKPDPEVFLRAAEGLNTAPEDCVVFEDAIAGIEAAQRADMKCVGVGDPQILGKADKVIPGFLGQNIELILF